MKINTSLDSKRQTDVSFKCFLLEQMGEPKQKLRKHFKKANTQEHGADFTVKRETPFLALVRRTVNGDVLNTEITFPLTVKIDANKGNIYLPCHPCE